MSKSTKAAASDKTAAEAVAASSRLGLLQRRRMGLTLLGLAPIVKQIKQEGLVDMDDHAAVAAEVMQRKLASGDRVWAEAGIDWDAVLEFIEKLIPLILQLISLF